MTDFLARLIQRQDGTLPTVQPRRPSIFATDTAGEDGPIPLQSDMPAINQEPLFPHKPMEPVRINQPVPTAPPPGIGRTTHRQPLTEWIEHSLPTPEQADPVEQANQFRSEEPFPRTPPVGPNTVDREVTWTTRPENHSSMAAQPRGRSDSLRPQALTRLVYQDGRFRAEPFRAPVPLASTTRSERRTERFVPQPTEPPVQVTIGRIEVSAVTEPSPRKRKPPVRPPAVTLQEYLSARRGKAT